MVQRVLHVVSAMNRGGAETLLMNVYRNIDRSKVQFDFVSHRMENCDYDEEIVSLGGKIFQIQSLAQSGPFAYINDLKKIMMQTKYKAVHSHTDYQSGFAALAGRMTRIPKRICHSHSNNWGKGKSVKHRMMLKAMRSLIKFAATDYCACSEEAARFLFDPLLINNGRIVVLKNGIELNRFTEHAPDMQMQIKQELNIPFDSKIIGHVGNFSASKNHMFLLKIVKQMTDEGNDVVAIMVGDGSLRVNIENEARNMGIFNKIRFLGVRADIPRFMKAFDVFVFPSLFEGFGIVTLEAQCSGTPCVVADTVPKLTDMGVNLIDFVSLDDGLAAWSKNINKAMFREKPDQSIIVNNIKSRGFDIKENVNDWLEIYGVS